MHNIENILCAVEIAKFFKLSHKTILDRLYRFVSLEHRLEFVCKKNNIVFINDSKATNVAATVKALHSLKGSIHLIIGGLGKNENYNPLLDASKNVKFVYAIGTEGRILNKKFKDICKSEFYFTLSDAVFHAKKNAKSGDVILFSPSCSSLDQFNNFSERGKYFKTLI
jgi:UDP-N-acetylmuramoylalanine--D-glutamate ligase